MKLQNKIISHINKILILSFTLFILAPNTPITVRPMTDDEIRRIIIDGNLKAFEGECPCPYSIATKNDPKRGANQEQQQCGDNSEYVRTRGRILCYPEDIKDIDVATYRQRYNIADPKAKALDK